MHPVAIEVDTVGKEYPICYLRLVADSSVDWLVDSPLVDSTMTAARMVLLLKASMKVHLEAHLEAPMMISLAVSTAAQVLEVQSRPLQGANTP